MKLKLNMPLLKRLVERKFEYKGIKITGMEKIFPADLPEILKGYWNRELGRLIYPVPELGIVIQELRNHLKPLIKPTNK